MQTNLGLVDWVNFCDHDVRNEIKSHVDNKKTTAYHKREQNKNGTVPFLYTAHIINPHMCT